MDNLMSFSEGADPSKQRKRKAEARKEGPVDKMQKKDLIEKISEVFSELPSGWDKFKRPELRAVTGAVFTSIQQQLLAGASGLDVTFCCTKHWLT